MQYKKNKQEPTTQKLRITNKTIRINKKTNQELKTYYKTNNKNQARYIRDKLEQHQYDKTIIPIYQQQYKKEKQEYKKQFQKKYNTINYFF